MQDIALENGRDPGLLDLISVRFIRPVPEDFQTENHLIASSRWHYLRPASMDDVRAAIETRVEPLWSNVSSSYNGLNDRIPLDLTNPVEGSLKLVAVTDLEVASRVEGAEFGNPQRKVRGWFTHAGLRHHLSITDPAIEAFYRGRNGTFPVGDAILCLSLGEPYKGHTYLLIAGVIRPQ